MATAANPEIEVIPFAASDFVLFVLLVLAVVYSLPRTVRRLLRRSAGQRAHME